MKSKSTIISDYTFYHYQLPTLQCSLLLIPSTVITRKNKLRILGSVSTSVQCVHNGRLIGNHHIRARVVSDLNKTFDTHCIAGDKLRQQLCPTAPPAEDNV